jgi:hypothetical protein
VQLGRRPSWYLTFALADRQGCTSLMQSIDSEKNKWQKSMIKRDVDFLIFKDVNSFSAHSLRRIANSENITKTTILMEVQKVKKYISALRVKTIYIF